jgi:hypothetical protein
VLRPGAHLDGGIAGADDPLPPVEQESNLPLAHLEPLDEVIVHVRPGESGPGLQPQVGFDQATVLRGPQDVGDLSRRRVVQPAARCTRPLFAVCFGCHLRCRHCIVLSVQ